MSQPASQAGCTFWLHFLGGWSRFFPSAQMMVHAMKGSVLVYYRHQSMRSGVKTRVDCQAGPPSETRDPRVGSGACWWCFLAIRIGPESDRARPGRSLYSLLISLLARNQLLSNQLHHADHRYLYPVRRRQPPRCCAYLRQGAPRPMLPALRLPRPPGLPQHRIGPLRPALGPQRAWGSSRAQASAPARPPCCLGARPPRSSRASCSLAGHPPGDPRRCGVLRPR